MALGKKTGGRKAGTPNKSTLTLEEQANEMGVDLWKLLLCIAQLPDHPRNFDAIKEACSYLFSKKRTIDMEVSAKKYDGVPVEELKKRLKAIVNDV